MKEAIDDLKCRVAKVRERVIALICLTAIAIVAMARLDDPENVIINVIVAIGSFVGGVATGHSQRATDQKM